MILETVALVLVLCGAVLCLTASIGLLRFRDVPSRLHAATKPQVLGLLFIAGGVAVAFQSWAVVAFLVPIVLIQLAASPIAAHIVGRQAYRNGSIDRDTILIDELRDE
ncbi:monovalent cation/H(+) antiporter subunit G [Microbacterium suaedae]|uniref:monovalent cation/H(+) antiporter subunit G n=1 Tax=Microbacterium suaedae TaxID=2067813 RepID=UPI000DA226F1|nr:monovalent cation/H(+) antiporter subunit G [Microbacterium suaedae]